MVMEQVFDFATRIETILSFLAFVFALVLTGYRAKLKRDEKLALEAKPENLDALNVYFRVETAGLTKQQKFDLALEQIRKGERGSKRWVGLFCLFGILLFGYAYFHQRTLQSKQINDPPALPSAQDSPKSETVEHVEATKNRFEFAHKGLLASFGTKDSCESVVETTSASSFSSFVSSDDDTSCTEYGKFTFVPFQTGKLDGEMIKFSVNVEFRGTQPGGAFVISGEEGTILSISYGEATTTEAVELRNNQRYVFHGNTQVRANTGGGSSKIVVSISAGDP